MQADRTPSRTSISIARRSVPPLPVFGLLALFSVACGSARAPVPDRPAAPPAEIRAVPVVRAERSLQATHTEVVGSVRAVREATIVPLLSGTITEVRVGIGTSVRAGEVLVRLSAREVDARLEQARARSVLANRERERSVALKDNGVISGAQYDAAISQWDFAQASQNEAASIADWTTLRAPFSGVITAKLVNTGDTALPGQRLLVLEGQGKFRFEARVPESAGRDLRAGARVPVRLAELEHELTGTITEIQPAADDATRTRLVKIDLPNTAATVRSGEFGRASFTTGKSFAVTVPAAAVARRGQLETVFVVDSGVARLRLVRLGREHEGRAEIFAGLSGGEAVALSAGAELADGQRVEAQEQVQSQVEQVP
ncbi:MAG TPA: efflux RND transporter periplasmic adaptor subunit [Polyangiaceae bacterium]|nr:efflux RND transporter periplasmic adaptor subunit [Polyangiaceae bacterium]